MTFIRRFGFLALSLAALGFSGCQRSNVIGIPPAPPPSLYTTDFGAQNVVTYAQPITPNSTPALTLSGASLGIVSLNGLGSDAAGNLYIADLGTNTIYQFNRPLTAASNIAGASAVIGPPAGASAIRRIGFDPQGNLWGADSGTNMLYQWIPPFGHAAPSFTITAAVPALANPLEPVFDNVGHMFVANFNNATLEAFAFPTLTPTPTASAVIATCAGPVDNAIDVLHRVYVSCASDPGDILVFAPPYATGNTPIFAIPSPFDHSLLHPLISGQALRFDASGNLYASFVAPADTLAIYAPPFSAGSVPLFTLATGQITSMVFAN
jgi:hypothetical protein